MLAFVPKDGIPSSVYIGKDLSPETLPSDEELIAMPVEKARELLNGAISHFLPSDREPTSSDIDKLGVFYKKHIRAIHMAWLIQPGTDCDSLHGFRILRSVGRGAFGRVYEVENPGTDERAAVKVLLPEVRDDREYLNSFRRGINSMRILTEKNVTGMVKIHSAYEIPACVFMDFVDGLTLREAVEQKSLESLSSCLEILVQIADVVQRAHTLDERVLHRDLKSQSHS